MNFFSSQRVVISLISTAIVLNAYFSATKVLIFGGISNETAAQKNGPTIYVNGTCMFGGVEIK